MINRWSTAGAEPGRTCSGAGNRRRRRRPERTAEHDRAAAGRCEERENGSLRAGRRRPAERVTPGKIPASWQTGRDGTAVAALAAPGLPGHRDEGSGGPVSGRLTTGAAPASSSAAGLPPVSFLPKLYPFTNYLANQHIADTAPESYVDHKGTKRIILDVEGACLVVSCAGTGTVREFPSARPLGPRLVRDMAAEFSVCTTSVRPELLPFAGERRLLTTNLPIDTGPIDTGPIDSWRSACRISSAP